MPASQVAVAEIDLIKFLLILIQNPKGGKDGNKGTVDFQAAGEAIGGMTGNAVYQRYMRLCKANGMWETKGNGLSSAAKSVEPSKTSEDAGKKKAANKGHKRKVQEDAEEPDKRVKTEDGAEEDGGQFPDAMEGAV